MRRGLPWMNLVGGDEPTAMTEGARINANVRPRSEIHCYVSSPRTGRFDSCGHLILTRHVRTQHHAPDYSRDRAIGRLIDRNVGAQRARQEHGCRSNRLGAHTPSHVRDISRRNCQVHLHFEVHRDADTNSLEPSRYFKAGRKLISGFVAGSKGSGNELGLQQAVRPRSPTWRRPAKAARPPQGKLELFWSEFSFSYFHSSRS